MASQDKIFVIRAVVPKRQPSPSNSPRHRLNRITSKFSNQLMQLSAVKTKKDLANIRPRKPQEYLVFEEAIFAVTNKKYRGQSDTLDSFSSNSRALQSRPTTWIPPDLPQVVLRKKYKFK